MRRNLVNVTKVPEDAPSQRAGSEILDKKTLDRLIEQGNDREKQRLRRLDCKHANSWITSLPSATDGRDTIMERQKHKRYDAGFKGSRYEFAAMVFETSGSEL